MRVIPPGNPGIVLQLDRRPGYMPRADPETSRLPVETQKRMFLECLKVRALVTHACHEAGLGYSTVYKWRDEDPAFRQAWDICNEHLADWLEAEALHRAVNGHPKPVVSAGKVMMYPEGHPQAGEPVLIYERSDRLLERALMARRPKLYRNVVEHSGNPDSPIVLQRRRDG